VDVDPTNNQVPGDAHILLAWGRDYDDVSPVKGVVLGGGEHSVKVAVHVELVVPPSGGAPYDPPEGTANSHLRSSR
jgi:transglutaminase-like putative cysteine protease